MPRSLLQLLLLTGLLIGAGIWEASGLSGKDEFFLGLRTPMEMMAGDHWLVPFLDEAPRIKKPPLLYWFGRASFELFGPSLAAARLIAVLFAGLLVAAAFGIGVQLARRFSPGGDACRYGLFAALILLGCLGLHSEGRRFMLDVPTAALSGAAFWSFLVWQDTQRLSRLTLATLLLAAGALVKGPVVGIVFASACLALAVNRLPGTSGVWPGRRALLAHLALFCALVLPWFWWVRHAYPEASALALDDEMASRQFLHLSPASLLALVSLGLPWGVVLIGAIWQHRAACRQPGWLRFSLYWLVFSSLPFVFMRSFDRYLVGSLLPLSLFLTPLLLAAGKRIPYGALRLGMLFCLLAGGSLAALSAWFGHLRALALLPVALGFAWLWWPARHLTLRPAAVLLAPALYWMTFFWLVFPSLGINAVPDAVVQLARAQPVAFFEGPQPAMLPILSGQSHRQLVRLDAASAARLAQGNTPLFAEAGAYPRLAADAVALGYALERRGGFATLATHGSGLRFVREGAGLPAWREALASRRPEPLMTQIDWYTLRRP